MKKILTTLVLYVAILVQQQLHAQPLSLQDCRRMALEHSETMKAADNAMRQAELDRQIAFVGYLPQVDGSLMGVYMKDQEMMGMKLQMRGTYMAGLKITLPLYAGGQITAGNRLARLGQQISEEQRRQARSQLLADVDNAYYQLIAVHSKVQMLEAFARQMQGLYDQVSLSVRAEMATENELLRIATKQNDISYQLQKARNGETLCRLALANVMGADFDTPIIPADTVLSVSVPQALSDNISNRPELHLLQKQVEVMDQQAKKARSNFLPTVALTGTYSHYGNLKLQGNMQGSDGNYYPYKESFDDGGMMAMLTVQVPIFHWGAEIRKARKARIDADNARLELSANERAMRLEVRQAMQNLTDGYRMVETSRAGQQQADENLRVMRQKYEAQMATLTDLLEAEAQWQQARSNLIEAQTQQKINETEYLRVTGRIE